MKVIVTGANGFIGSHVVKELKQQNYDVRAFVRTTSDLTNLEGFEQDYVYGDILEPETLRPALEGCDMVFHVAAIFAYWGYSSDELNRVAEQGTRNLIKAAHNAGVEKVILTSSSVVLGYNGESLSLQNDAKKLSDQPDYIISKIKQFEAAQRLARGLGITLLTVCPTLVVGGSDVRLSEGNRMIVNYLQDPYKSTWLGGSNIVSVKDVAKAHVLVAEKGSNDIYYVVGSDNMEWTQVHRILSKLTGLAGPLVTANHTVSYLSAMVNELMSLVSGNQPTVSRAQSKMVGHCYWYNNEPIKALGLSPMSSRQALAEAVSWLVTSDHIPPALRSQIQLSDEIYKVRQDEL
jgi:dihydroflavonol-4-reductase